jgi:dTDP-glucose 4,6-dehydratase
MQDLILVTGGAGFIGSNFILQWMASERSRVLNLDKLTYAGNLHNLASVENHPNFAFEQGDILDRDFLRGLLQREQPRAIVHFAAESHVDRSIHGPDAFIKTNINGTFHLLEETRAYCSALPEGDRSKFRYLHVSTDEVYGSLGPNDPAFAESTAYAPNSPYSASKAASDHLVRAYHHTYHLPVLTTNCSNNYGPFQFPEKLIQLCSLTARSGRPITLEAASRKQISTLSIGFAGCLMNFAPTIPRCRIASWLHLLRTAPDMIGATPWTRAKSNVNWAGVQSKHLKAESGKPFFGILNTPIGRRMLQPAVIGNG